MMKELRAVGMHHEAPEDATTTALLNFKLVMEKLQHGKINSIADEFGDLLMFDKFTANEDLETTTPPKMD